MQLNLNNTKTPEEKTDVKTNGNFFSYSYRSNHTPELRCFSTLMQFSHVTSFFILQSCVSSNANLKIKHTRIGDTTVGAMLSK